MSSGHQSRQTYPTRWTVSFPDLDADLDVRPVIHESKIVSDMQMLNKYEGASRVEGIYKGNPTKGYCFVELLGDGSEVIKK